MFSHRSDASSCLSNIPYEDKLSSFTLDKKFLDPTTQCQLAFGLKPENTTIRPYLHQNVKYTFKKRNIKIDFQITKNCNLEGCNIDIQYISEIHAHNYIFYSLIVGRCGALSIMNHADQKGCRGLMERNAIMINGANAVNAFKMHSFLLKN